VIYQDSPDRNHEGGNGRLRDGFQAILKQIKSADVFCFGYFNQDTNMIMVSGSTGLDRLAKIQKFLLDDIGVPEAKIVGPPDEEPCMLSKLTTAHFDGEILRPVERLDLEKDRSYLVTVLAEAPPRPATAWDVLDEFTGSVDGPSDLSAEIDHYLYGLPKRSDEAAR
jgi:hypothetical protein